MVFKQDILPTEVVSISKLEEKDSGTSLSTPDMRKFSIPMGFIDNPLFAGTLRQGDLIDIVYTKLPSAQNPIPFTIVQAQKVVVLDAIDNTGKHLTKTDTALAAEIILEGNPNETAKLTNSQFSGKFKFIQTQKQSNKYTPVAVKQE